MRSVLFIPNGVFPLRCGLSSPRPGTNWCINSATRRALFCTCITFNSSSASLSSGEEIESRMLFQSFLFHGGRCAMIVSFGFLHPLFHSDGDRTTRRFAA